MDLKTLADNFGILLDAPDAVENLRRLIIDLAISGKLVDPSATKSSALSVINKIQEKLTSHRSQKTNGSQNGGTLSGPFAIPTHWAWTQLSKLGLINPRNDLPEDLEVSFIPMKLVPEGFKGTAQSEVKTWREIKNGFTHFAEGDVALAKITPCFQNRKSCVLRQLHNKAGAGTTELHIFRPVDPSLLIPDYVLLYLKSAFFVEGGVPKMTGTAGQKRVPNSYFSDSPFPLPPTEEQHRIVAKVDHLMQLCDELEQKKEKVSKTRSRLNTVSLEKLVSARNADEFDECWGRVSCNFDLLFKNYDDLNELRRSTLSLAAMGKLTAVSSQNGTGLGLIENIARKQNKSFDVKIATKSHHEVPFELPEHWTWARFDHVAEIASNLVKPNDYLDLPHVAPDSIEKHTGRLLRYQTVREDHVISANHHFFSEQILYSKIRPNLGKAIISSFEGLCSADMYPLNSFINSRFLLLYILSPVFLRMAVKKDTRVAMPKINQAELSEILVPVPPTIEQEAIVNKADKILNLCNDLAKRLAVVDSLHSFVAKSAFGTLCDSNTTIYQSANSSPSQGQEACNAE